VNTWITETVSKRRDKLSIIAEILNIAKNGTLKTQIMYKANLSFTQLNEYLGYMLKTRLLDKLDIHSKEVYVATEKGVDFLKKHAELATMLDEKHRNNTMIPLSKPT
jgi:predicted transcriptional regulator